MSPREPYLFDWGAELLLHHAPEPAQEVFTRAHRIFPKSARILIGLGSSLLALGSYDDAVQRVCEASDLNPGDLTPYLILGKMDEIGSVKSAVLATYLQRFASLHPNSAQSNYYYAVALWKRRTPQQNARELAQVESLLKKAVGLDPHLGAAYLQFGILHAEKRDFSQAIADYRQAMQASPGLKEAHYRRLEFANNHFAENTPGWKTDRGRVYIVYGRPDIVTKHAGTAIAAPEEIWSYVHTKAGDTVLVKFVDDCRCGKFSLKTDLPRGE